MVKFKVEITEYAESEYVLGFEYYEEQVVGLGVKFESEADTLLKQISENPYLFQRKFKHYREAIFRKFPYFIVFEIVDNLIVVHSFFHTSRNPNNKLQK
jgi:plasmid stabilization system protein ParE